MTEFFPFDQLTWPDVAALPRYTPLVIPLGVGYPMDQLANALGDPPRVGMLPPIPFGWPGSGLAVPSPILRISVDQPARQLTRRWFFSGVCPLSSRIGFRINPIMAGIAPTSQSYALCKPTAAS